MGGFIGCVVLMMLGAMFVTAGVIAHIGKSSQSDAYRRGSATIGTGIFLIIIGFFTGIILILTGVM